MNLKDCLNQDLTRYESIPFWSWNDELEPDELRRQMDQAVQDEEFEQAARLRDRIRELTREQDANSGSADQKEGNADAGE